MFLKYYNRIIMTKINKKIKHCAYIIFASLFLINSVNGQDMDNELENRLHLELKGGVVVIQLYPELAPNHVKRIKELARMNFYDNTPIHRVIDGFMAQMGDPTGTGSGGSDLPDLKSEFSNEPHVRGIVSMARTPDPNSANSQFFIMFDSAPSLDNQYTVWGKVIEGMEFVDKIKKGDDMNGIVDNPDFIISLKVASDIK
ncbi:MAG: Peptidyl-prolyl cis-trans isomerase B [Alphaproteobacteria bacterium MarineAlpha2_Bin1]|nr:MAG: Peptidyl-prolyl cis-trans isomerase B [Alphaproteobacteria bacterium MarineAlpha2_Bin1]